MIGTRIQQWRKERNLSLTELADKAGIAKSYISAIERGIQSNPSVQMVEKIASALGISPNQLLNGDGEPVDELDVDWKELVRLAMENGLSKEEFREYLEFQKWKKKQSDK